MPGPIAPEDTQMRTAWIAVVSALWASTAWGLALPIVEVSAPDINCVFDLDCTIVVNDSSDELALPGGVGRASRL